MTVTEERGGLPAAAGPGLSIADAAAASGLSAHTLRYYERVGLLRPPERTSGGRRVYAESDLAWLTFLTRLRSTGMPIRLVRRYAELVFAGPGNEADRLALLEAHREQVRERVAAAQRDLIAIDTKVDLYRKLVH